MTQFRTAMSPARIAIAALLAASTLAGCSGSGISDLFGSKPQTAPAVDPNAYPANYRKQIAGYLITELADRADFQGALIAAPAIKPVGQSQRYVVCLQFNGHNLRKDRVAIYLAGSLQQYVKPTQEQCGDAAYQPFDELAAVTPG
jgi:hypothetical protein